jgi:hypothetical protein
LRDNFGLGVKRRLAERVQFVCSNPDCEATTIGPAAKAIGVVNVGVAAHITAASRNGPRYNEKLTPQQRKSVGNGIWLCQTCGKAVDSDESTHTVDQLLAWKSRAEQMARMRLGVTRSNRFFHLLPNDQTMYINLRRFEELARRNHIDVRVNQLGASQRLLDLGGSLPGFVMENERILKAFFPEAFRVDSTKTITELKWASGTLIQFEGHFRSKNAPRLRKDGSIPMIHPSGDIEQDHVVYKEYRRFRLVLPLEPLWFASHSSVGFLRRRSPIRGLGVVHQINNHDVIASPLWLALPAEPPRD